MARRSAQTKTPLIAAFFVSVTLLLACRQGDQLTELDEHACALEVTAIAAIQGNEQVSGILNETVTARGVVTHVEASTGLFIEEVINEPNRDASAGLFISNATLATRVSPGDQILVQGMVSELGDGSDTMTSLNVVTGYRVCASGQALPLIRVKLPLTENEREALEGMRLGVEQDLFVTDPRNVGMDDLTLSMDGVLPIPTEISRPGQDARRQSLKNRRSAVRIRLDESDEQLFPAGTTILSLEGVLGHDGRGLRLYQNKPLRTIPIRVNRVKAPAGADLRVLGLNLHNYFNGNGRGGGFPTSRGAETPAEFQQQRNRLAATVQHIKPHIVAVMELENDGFGENSAAADFIRDLENASGASWQVAAPWDGPIGADVITVGIFYQPDRLTPAGNASVLNGPEFERLSRVPLAQKFVDNGSGNDFLVVVNHLKSKGSCPEDGPDANMNDGQGCWNPARKAAATVMAQWTLALANSVSGGRALILGDMNAYRMEDPITAILDVGFHDLKAASGLRPEFSFIYAGQGGTLDYAFASPELRQHVQMAIVPNFNSPYARELDLPLPWLGASDHDPVVVDLRFRQSSTSD